MEDIKVIREEFKKYLYKQVADNKLSKVDADTQYSDADYIRKHEDELLISYYSIFISNERFEQALLNLKKQFQNQGKRDSTFYAYKRALNSYKMFFEEYIKDQLKVYLAKYFTHKSSPNYDEQYKYDYFAKNSYIFDDLNDLSEKFIQLGSPNFVPYMWKSSMFRHLAFKHSFQFSQILENLFNEILPINTRIEDFRKDIKEILLKDSEWNNKNMIDPSVESASFFLSLKYPNKYLLFTRIKPYTNFSKDFHLGLEKFNNEDRYIAWIDYCKNNLIPLLNNYCNSNCNLLDCQDFIWFVFNQNKGDNMSLKEKFIKYVYDVVYKSNQSYLQYGKKIENLDNVILNLTNKQIYEIQNSEELSSLLFQLKKISEWQDYNYKNGNGIPYAILNTHYRKFIQNNIVKDNSMKQEANFAQEKIYQPLNQILYGPPGTGKTFSVRRYIDEILGKNPGLNIENEDQRINNVVKDSNWYSAIALSMYQNGKNNKYKVAELLEQKIIKTFSLTRENKNVRAALWAQMQIHTHENCPNVNYSNRLAPFIFEKNENSEWYLTEDGIKFVEENLSEQLEQLNAKNNTRKLEYFYKFLTFHQSYSYEEFVEGIKPQIRTDEECSSVSYEYNKGVFKEICQQANSDPDNNYLLIMDEINRGNISKIFGELITLIEINKRVMPNGERIFENTVTKDEQLLVTLPYTKSKFGVPNNLYILGTMNTSDRSIASIDIALRRRFVFKEIMPNVNLIPDIEVFGIELRKIFKTLNERISILLDRNHQIGHSYFMKLENSSDYDSDFKCVWYDCVIPLLNEYFYGDWEKLCALLGDSQPEGKSFIKKINNVTFANNYSCDEDETYDFVSEANIDFKTAIKNAFKNI